MSEHPPRPRLTLRVGITGHRWDKLKHEHERELIAQLRGVLVQVAEIAERIREDPEGGYRGRYSRPGERAPLHPELRLTSALAEGADRLLVEAAPKGWRLQAVLPFAPEGYQRDATTPDSADQLQRYLDRAGAEAGVLILDGKRDAENAFEPVATAICLNSDVLIAIWNGLPGRRGGTAAVVALATRMGIPVIRVAPAADKPPWLHRRALEDHGAALGLHGLEERLERLFSAPPAQAHAERHSEVPDLREEYFAERHRKGKLGTLYGFLLRIVGYEWKNWKQFVSDLRHPEWPYLQSLPADYPEAIRARWREKWGRKLGLSSEFIEPILATPLADHYGWASSLANYYAGRYRSSFLWAYGLSWIAVLSAATGMAVYLLGYQQPWSVLTFAGAETLLLLAILTVVVLARNGSFHERWLAYRALTERLRSLTYTLPLGRASTLRADLGPTESPESWVDWMHRAVVREVGIIPARMTAEHLLQAQRLLVEGELADQVRYHQGNSDRLMRVESRLSSGTSLVFFGGIVLAVLHFKDGILEATRHEGLWSKEMGTLLGVVGLTIPALAAAVHGFLSQAEFKETAIRSRSTQRHLGQLLELGRSPEADMSSEALGALAAAAATAMDAELGAWFAAYQGKEVPLP